MLIQKKWFYKQQALQLQKNLKLNNIDAQIFDDGIQAKSKILSLICENDLVGFGGSKTIQQIGLLEGLSNGKYNILDRFDKSLSKDEKWELQRKALLSDIFITGTNAIAITGELVNVDHSGNRVAGMIYGPNKVFIVIGANKICSDINSALHRATKYASPINAKRAEKDHNAPCLAVGKCINCNSSESICNHTVITKRQYKKNRVTVFIVLEELGF